VGRAGTIFVPERNSFFHWIVVVRVALVLKHVNKNHFGAIDWGSNDFDVVDGRRLRPFSDMRTADEGFQSAVAKSPLSL